MSYFQVADPGRASFVGGFTATNAGEIKTGVLVRGDANQALTLADASNRALGFAFTQRSLVYAPLAVTADAGEYVTVVNGHVKVWADADFFYGGTLPSIGDTIYQSSSGLMATSGTLKLGRASKSADYRTPPNSSTNLIFLELEVGDFEAV